MFFGENVNRNTVIFSGTRGMFMSKNLVSIKGSKFGLLFSFNTMEASFAELCAALEEKLMGSGDFFNNAEYIIQNDQLFSTEEISLIEGIMEKYCMTKSVSSVQNEKKEEREEMTFQAHGGDSVMIMRGVRSGQKLNIRGNAIIMGDINPGGEIVASGSIVVLGCCRGLLHAGAEGDRDAYIVVYILASQQLRIADHVASLTEDLSDLPLKAAMIQDGGIVITDYQPSQFAAARAAN